MIIALIYLLEPIGNLIQAAYINGMPLIGKDSIVGHLIWSDWIILGLFPVVAVGIYRVKRWGWYLFIGFSTVLIGYNLYVYRYANANYHLHTIIVFILIITGISGIFFRKHVYAPYFNPRLRWWEVASRCRITLNTVITTKQFSVNCHVLDISTSGCFVDYTGDLGVGETVWIVLQCRNVEISLLGRVIRKTEEKEASGYGIIFQSMSQDTRHKIKCLIRKLEALGGRDRKGSIPESRLPVDFVPKKGLFFHHRLWWTKAM